MREALTFRVTWASSPPRRSGSRPAARYLSESRYKGKVKLTGLGTPNQMRKFVKDGTVTEFALWSSADGGVGAAYTRRHRS
jgi:rhamnose transport system substrate-binding protein